MTLMRHSDSVLLQASRLARLYDASLTLIHTGASQAASETYIRDTAAVLDIDIDQKIVWNQTDPAVALLNAARQHQLDLLVCGAFEGPSINKRRFLSPLARSLTEDLPCSLLLLAHPEFDNASFRRIVAITDFSETSKVSCRHAVWLAEKDKSESLHVVSIHSIFQDAVVALQRGSAEKVVRTREAEENLLEEFVMELPDVGEFVDVDFSVIDATTGFAACDFAESVEADLLVLPWYRESNRKVPPLADWALQVVPCNLLLVPS